MSRSFALGALFVFLAAPAVSRAADNSADGPTLMVRVQSINQLIDYGGYLAELAGPDAVIPLPGGQKIGANPILAFIKALAAGEKGIEGVDPKKPFIFYASSNEKLEQSAAVLMIPVADKDSFLNLLKGRVKLEIKDEKDGLFSTSAPSIPFPVYFRFANNYVYFTLINKANIDAKKVAKLEDVAVKGDGLFSVAFRIDRLPEQMKQFALGGIETALAEAKNFPLPNETEKVKAVKAQAIDSLSGAVKAILFEGQELTFRINVLPKKDELSVEFDLTPKKGSDFAKDLADLHSRKGVAIGSLASSKAAMLIATNLALPGSVKKLLAPAIDELVKAGLDMAPGEFQEALEPLVKAALPTLKSGDFDGGMVLLGPDADGKHTVVLCGKLASGKGLESAAKELVKKIPEPVQSAFEIDAATDGDFKLHMVKIRDQIPDNAKKVFGETDLWFAFRNDALMISFGPDGKNALKEALSRAPASGALVKVELNVVRLAAIEEAESGANKGLALKIAKDVFGKDGGASEKISIAVESDDSLRFRVATSGRAVKYLLMVKQAKEKKEEEGLKKSK